MFTKRYELINNVTGWIVFVIALATYWCTLEPTASYWDCGEFTIQADKLEVGHPPGNPIFMLTARFFANFAPDSGSVSVMVNAMSGLLSALTILLLFWTITHLVRRLVVADRQKKEISLQQYLAIMGSGVVGALAYCWSDTFWFSAVEAEVYAFSSFCTALVFWLILKWENRADMPHSDRYLILIAYIIGVSVAVHLLNLLCIPAIVLVYAYRKWDNMNLTKSLLALLVSFVMIALVLFGLVPGFIKVAQRFELLFVNGFHMGFNSGTIIYGLLTVVIFLWAIYELYREKSSVMIKLSFFLSVAISGIFFFGNGFVIGFVLLAALAALLFFYKWKNGLPLRTMNVILWSMAVIFVGYSSYALILIRSTADTPMNQNSPDNVFDLASYLNREQYGENPLLYGETLYSSPQKKLQGMARDTIYVREDGSAVVLPTPYYQTVVEKGKPMYAKGVRNAQPKSEYGFLSTEELASNAAISNREGDYYVKTDYKPEVKMNPELNMLFPRIYSRMHREAYKQWVNLDTVTDNLVAINAIDETTGESLPELDLQKEPQYNEMTGAISYPPKYAYKPTFAQNLAYFFNYQLTHMYLRYFMWNFAGRQNDLLNQLGEADAGNWISGIPFIDNTRLGDQSLLPEDLGEGNKGHNVYFMLPLILGIIGLLWQAFAGKRGIEQFWVVFFLFFMTGIAIVLYLNQPPSQPRERDYAFAGSFYAYAIWIGMGVAGLWRIFMYFANSEARKKKQKRNEEEETQLSSLTHEPESLGKKSVICVAAACVLGAVVPVQMVSQTWDDHDRSGRYAARDFGINYLNSLEPNAIVFCNGDNDTFPLWYAQEVEGVRPDVKIINLSYLNSDWYANQMRMQTYTAPPVEMTAQPSDYAFGRQDVAIIGRESAPADLLSSLKLLYKGEGVEENGYPTLPSGVVTIPVDKKAVIARGVVAAKDSAYIVDRIAIDLRNTDSFRSKGYLSLGEILMLDIIATNAANGWPRPIYWCSTVGNEYHVGLTPYLRSTGMTNQLVATYQENMESRTDRAYDNVTKKYKWGGADKATPGKAPYFDETARRMLISMRTSMVDVASELLYEGDVATADGDKALAKNCYDKALGVLNLMQQKLPESVANYNLSVAMSLAQLYCELGDSKRLGDKKVEKQGLDLIWSLLNRYMSYLVYNRHMAMSFGNPSMTTESRYMPYQYYRFIELYEDYGGDKAKLNELLKKNGFTKDELRKNYERLMGGGSVSAETSGESLSADEAALKQYTEEIAGYAEKVNKLAGMSAEEYAKTTSEDRLIDSMFIQAVDYFKSIGGTEEMLQAYPAYKNVDMARSRRLSDEFSVHNPR